MRAVLVAALCVAGCKDTPKHDATTVAKPSIDWTPARTQSAART
jgi:hypothetical protein